MNKYSNETRQALIKICKEKNIKGYSGKTKEEIMKLLQGQDTGKFRTNTKDQFYTKENVAKSCIEHIIKLVPDAKKFLWVEPSAGNGSFFNNISYRKIGLDIDPMGKDICKQDYFTWNPPPKENNIIVFGNPPFGRQSSLAKAFISKSCEYAKLIAFILPRSFTKPSMNNAFTSRFHCILSIDLDKNSFLVNGSEYDVPCIFQIWSREDTDRPIEKKVDPIGFQYVKFNDDHDLITRRVGVFAGQCFLCDEIRKFSPQSHYFIKLNDEKRKFLKQVVVKCNNHIFPSNTTGPRSLSKTEINVVLNGIINSLS